MIALPDATPPSLEIEDAMLAISPTPSTFVPAMSAEKSSVQMKFCLIRLYLFPHSVNGICQCGDILNTARIHGTGGICDTLYAIRNACQFGCINRQASLKIRKT